MIIYQSVSGLLARMFKVCISVSHELSTMQEERQPQLIVVILLLLIIAPFEVGDCLPILGYTALIV